MVTYAYQVRCGWDEPYLIDATDPSHSNWMRFINHARTEEEQNVTVFEFIGQVYYHTCKTIHPGMELLVGMPKENDDGEFGIG